MTALKLTFFGSPQLSLGDHKLTEKITGKTLALFSYLAITGQSHSRDLLADLLWSELSNQRARNNLRYLLPDLRRVVDDYLVITPQAIGFNRTSSYLLDIEIFRTTLTVKPEQVKTADLQAALDLYQGELLAGFTVRNAPVFEAWLTREREEFHTLAVRGLYQLAEHYWQARDHNAGLAITQRLLTLEPWCEAGHRLRMLFLVHSNQRTEALAQFKRCQQILAEEVGALPEAETVTLYEQIRDGIHDEACDKTESLGIKMIDALIAPSLGHNLPSQLTPFLGREEEVTTICTRLLAPDCRLITLVGEGGVGKTRLALAVGQRVLDLPAMTTENRKSKIENFPDGVWFVPLAGIKAEGHTLDALVAVIGQALGLHFTGNEQLAKQLFMHLRQRQLLLIVDNFEHLISEGTFVLDLLQAAPGVRLLVTSRQRLDLQAEIVWRVEGLPLPPMEAFATLSMSDLRQCPGIALFCERAQRTQRTFILDQENCRDVLQICHQVAGLPLGIELAAALVMRYTVAEIATSVAQNYKILAAEFHDLPSRHRSFQATLDYSWHLLRPEAANILAQCALFQGSFDHRAAATVTGATLAELHKFVDLSLLRVHEGRFSMHDLVRQYAASQLGQSLEQQHYASAAHAAYYMGLLDELKEALLVGVDAKKTLQDEAENVRAAWCWSVHAGNLALLTKGIESLYYYYRLCGIYRPAIQLLEAALTVVRQAIVSTPTDMQFLSLFARLLCRLAEFHRRTGSVKEGEHLAQEALEVGQRLVNPTLQALAYHELARLAYVCGNFRKMHDLAQAGCQQARQTKSLHLLGECLNDMGLAVATSISLVDALPYYHQALATLQDGSNRILEAFVLVNLGFFSMAACQYQAAYNYLQQGLTWQRLLQDRGGRLPTLIHLSNLRLALGAYSEAQSEYNEAFSLIQTLNDARLESQFYISYGRWQYLSGNLAGACTACTHAQQIAQQRGLDLEEQWSLVYLGHALLELGKPGAARDSYQQAIALHKAGNWLYRSAEAYTGLAALSLAEYKITEAVTQVETALDLLAQHGLPAAAEPFTVYWTCVRVLKAAHDPRAQQVLRAAYQALQEIAGKLEDRRLQRSFLDNVLVNRNLIAAAQAAGLTEKVVTP